MELGEGDGPARCRRAVTDALPKVPKLSDLRANSRVSNKQPEQTAWKLPGQKRSTEADSPGFGQQDGVLVRRRGFWKVAENGEPVLQELCSVVREQNVQRLHVALLEADPWIRTAPACNEYDSQRNRGGK